MGFHANSPDSSLQLRSSTAMPQIKYRAACDHCSATKIKCTQERPQCTRCQTLGRECHYSRSLRAGKPPRSSQGLNRKLPSAPVLPRHGTPLQQPPILQTPDTGWVSSPAPYPTPPAIAPTSNGDVFHFPDLSSASTDASSASASPASADWFFDFNNCATSLNNLSYATSPAAFNSPSLGALHFKQDQESRTRCGTPSAIDLTAFDDLTAVQGMPVGLVSSNNIEGDRCARLANQTLNSLYEMPRTQIDSSGNKQPSMDQALSTAAQAVNALQELINCNCAKDFHLPMLISIIASKTIAWYQAIVYVPDPATNEFSDGQHPLKEIVVEGPLALGAYQLDDKVGWTLKNQIVLGQLQTLNELVGRFNSMYCGNGHGSEGAGLYASMGTFLRNRVAFTVREIEGRLMSAS